MLSQTHRVIALTVLLTLVTLAAGGFANRPSGTHSGSPYASALWNATFGTGTAAARACNKRGCEFFAPAWSCTIEAGGANTNCVRANGGCTTSACR